MNSECGRKKFIEKGELTLELKINKIIWLIISVIELKEFRLLDDIYFNSKSERVYLDSRILDI